MASILSQPLALPAPTPRTPPGVTKVHMGGQGLRKLVGTWGSYNMGICRTAHIAMKLSPREQQLCLSGGQIREQRSEGMEQSRGCLSITRQLTVISPCFSTHPQPLASSQLPPIGVTGLPDRLIGTLHGALIPSHRTLIQQVRKSCVVTEWQFRAPAAKSHFWTVWRVSDDGWTSSATSSRVRYFPAGIHRGFCLHSLLFQIVLFGPQTGGIGTSQGAWSRVTRDE